MTNRRKEIRKDEIIKSRITKDFKNRIREYAKKNSMSMSEVLEKALIELIGE